MNQYIEQDINTSCCCLYSSASGRDDGADDSSGARDGPHRTPYKQTVQRLLAKVNNRQSYFRPPISPDEQRWILVVIKLLTHKVMDW